MNADIFEPCGRGALSWRIRENPNTNPARGLSYEICLPVRCLIDRPDDVAYPQYTKTSFSLIRLGQDSWRDFPGRSFAFPVNPADGYVDGSIYFGQQHHYVDLTELKFIGLEANVLSASVNIAFMFTRMPDFPALPESFETKWQVELEVESGLA